jgi:predicted ATPase
LTRADRARPRIGERSHRRDEAAELGEISQRPTNIAPQTTSFVGRVAELADLHQLFRQGTRLVTLLGPGGTGKTRLSLQFGTQLVTHFQTVDERGKPRGGVWFVELGEARDVDGICAAIVSCALNVPLAAGRFTVDTARPRRVVEATRDVLIVLDNFEQVAPRAREGDGREVVDAALRTLGSWSRRASCCGCQHETRVRSSITANAEVRTSVVRADLQKPSSCSWSAPAPFDPNWEPSASRS